MYFLRLNASFCCCFIIIIHLITAPALAASTIKTTIIKLSPLPITQHTVELPLNEYYALQILAFKEVSSSQVPRPYNTPLNTDQLLPVNHDSVVDLNHNDIRDDYERLLLAQYQRPEYVAMGILAAAHWNRLTTVVAQDNRISLITAMTLIANNIAINQCYYSLQQIDDTLMSPILSYFNTEQRITLKHQAEEKLLAIIATSPFTVIFEPQPCQRFTLLAESMLKTTFVAH